MGTSFSYVSPCSSIQDHPHAYGDKLIDKYSIYFDEGSSPRVWGQVFINRKSCKNFGIIPTRMGTSILLCVVLYRGTDHPHAYGDKYRFKVARTLDNGSSPRVWGQGEMIFQRIQQLRIIPTRMGTRLGAFAGTL